MPTQYPLFAKSRHVVGPRRDACLGRAAVVGAQAGETLAYAWAEQSSRCPQPARLNVVQGTSLGLLVRRDCSSARAEAVVAAAPRRRAEPLSGG